MNQSFQLTDAMNTYTPALLSLQRRGYQIWLESSDIERELDTWWAKKDDAQFAAFDPLRLLGLVSLWEQRGSQWERQGEEDNLYEKFLTAGLASN